jgi:hypothetical protein
MAQIGKLSQPFGRLDDRPEYPRGGDGIIEGDVIDDAD